MQKRSFLRNRKFLVKPRKHPKNRQVHEYKPNIFTGNVAHLVYGNCYSRYRSQENSLSQVLVRYSYL